MGTAAGEVNAHLADAVELAGIGPELHPMTHGCT